MSRHKVKRLFVTTKTKEIGSDTVKTISIEIENIPGVVEVVITTKLEQHVKQIISGDTLDINFIGKEDA